MKRWKTVYMILFFAICLVPSAGMLLGYQESSSENRELAEAPSLRDEKEWNWDFFMDEGEWFEDHFAFRNELVTGNAKLMSKVFSVSTDDGVIVGKDGWLYYRDSLEDYQGGNLMSDRQLFDVAHTLFLVQNYAKEKNIRFVFVVAPNKNTLYGEQMPYYYQYFRDKETNLSRIGAYLESEKVEYVDLYNYLSSNQEVLYHRTDSHWNNKGAALVAEEILTALGQNYDSYSDREYEVRRDFEGDLETMLYPAAVEKEEEIYYKPQPQYEYVQEVESNFAPKISTNGIGEGSLVMYRDSFGNALLPFLAEAYENAYFSRGVPYQLSDLLACEADTLIIERAERFLPDMAKNAPVMPAPLIPADQLVGERFADEFSDLEITNQGVYTKITGTITDELPEVSSRIYIRINQLLSYEAFPVSLENGREGFELYIVSELLKDEKVTVEMNLTS